MIICDIKGNTILKVNCSEGKVGKSVYMKIYWLSDYEEFLYSKLFSSSLCVACLQEEVVAYQEGQ